MLELQQRTTAVANAAKQSLRDAKAAKPAVLHIQQNEPFDTKAAKGGHAGFAAIDTQSGYAGFAAIPML